MKRILVFYCLLSFLFATAQKKEGMIQTGKLSVHYVTQGKGSPLIFLHGGFLDTRMWEKQFSYFSTQYKVIAIDLPGHGLTKGIDSFLLVADVLRNCMDSLHIKKASFIGLSLGTTCATDFTLAYPERVNKLILVSPGLSGWADAIKLDTLSKALFEKMDVYFEKMNFDSIAYHFAETWCVGPFRKFSDVDAFTTHYVLEAGIESLHAHPEHNNWPQLSKTTAAKQFHRIDCPLLVITGDKDAPFIMSVAKWMHAEVKNSSLVIFPGVAHMLNLEMPEAFNKELAAFLRK